MSWNAPRTWVAGELVTAAMLNVDIRDNMKVGRGYSKITKTAANYTCNNTSWADLDNTMDRTLPAATNDIIEANVSGLWSSEAVSVGLDVVCVTGGAHFGAGGASDYGVMSWFGNPSVYTSIGGPVFRELAAGDISGGNVALRLRYRTSAGSNKTMIASTAQPLVFTVRNLGPAVLP